MCWETIKAEFPMATFSWALLGKISWRKINPSPFFGNNLLQTLFEMYFPSLG